MSEIIQNLYIGDEDDARYLSNNMKFIINCTTNIPFYNFSCKSVRFFVYDNGDSKQCDHLFKYIQDHRVFKDIERCLSKGEKVLVHCNAGRQRSAAIVACYLIMKYKIDVQDAISFIQSKRQNAFSGGVHFYTTIKRYQDTLHSHNPKSILKPFLMTKCFKCFKKPKENN